MAYIILLDRLNELNMKYMTFCLLEAVQSRIFIDLGYCRRSISWV